MATVSLIRPEPRAAHSLSGEQLCQEAAAPLGARWSSRSEDLEHTMEQQNKDHSQPAEGQQSVQEQRQVRLRERDRDSSVTGWHGEHQDGNGAGASWPAGPEHLRPGRSYSQTWGFSMKSQPPGQPKPMWPWHFCAQRHKEQRGLIQPGCLQPGAVSIVPPCGQAASAVVPRERASHWQLPHGVGSPRRVRKNIFGSPGSLRRAGSNSGGDRQGITLASRAPLCVVPCQGMNGATAGQLTGAPLGGRGGEWQK